MRKISAEKSIEIIDMTLHTASPRDTRNLCPRQVALVEFSRKVNLGIKSNPKIHFMWILVIISTLMPQLTPKFKNPLKQKLCILRTFCINQQIVLEQT